MEQLNNEGHRRFKDDLYEEFARTGKALAHPKRLEILDLLAQKERSVKGLAEAMSISVANASQHLQTLLEANLVQTRKEGTYRYYQPTSRDVIALWRSLRDVGQRHNATIDAIVEETLGPREGLQAQDPQQEIQNADKGEVILLDVRPKGEYEEAHLPGARSIPIDEIEERLHELPSDTPVLVYCRGPFCVYSDQAVHTLTKNGYAAQRLEPGLSDWKALNVPLKEAEA